MGVTIKWDNEEKTIIYSELLGRWTWDEYIRAAGEMGAMLKEVDHTVYFIYTLENPNYLPPNALSQIANFQRKRPANAGMIVIVGGKLFVKTLIQALSRVNENWGDRFQFTETIEEAQALISEKMKSK